MQINLEACLQNLSTLSETELQFFLDGSSNTMHFWIFPRTPAFQSWGNIFYFDLCVDAYLGSNLEIGAVQGLDTVKQISSEFP